MARIGISVFPPKIMFAHNQKVNITFDCWFEKNDTLVEAVIGQSWHWDPGRVHIASILVLGHGIGGHHFLVIDNTAQFSVVKNIPVQCSAIKGMTVQYSALQYTVLRQCSTLQCSGPFWLYQIGTHRQCTGSIV